MSRFSEEEIIVKYKRDTFKITRQDLKFAKLKELNSKSLIFFKIEGVWKCSLITNIMKSNKIYLEGYEEPFKLKQLLIFRKNAFLLGF